MLMEEFIIGVYCKVEDEMRKITENRKLRQRGFSPQLTDSEIITMEIVGEFIKLDTDKGIHQYFKTHWRHFFPKIGDRTTFVRQAANLWECKNLIRASLFKTLYPDGCDTNVIDGLPMPVCGFKRANSSKVFRGFAAYGYCASKDMHYYGFEGHLLVTIHGMVSGFSATAANVDEREMIVEVGAPANSLLLGDKGYILALSRKLDLDMMGIDLQTPLKSNMKDPRPKWIVDKLKNMRRIIETVIGQLSERFHIEKVRARDRWHLTARIARKLLAHMVACLMCHENGYPMLQFDSLLDA
jgi:hypothetical protein